MYNLNISNSWTFSYRRGWLNSRLYFYIIGTFLNFESWALCQNSDSATNHVNNKNLAANFSFISNILETVIGNGDWKKKLNNTFVWCKNLERKIVF